jgi:hypothetical protein
MARKVYEVISPLRHNGKDYAPGKRVELEDDEAASLVGHTVKAPEPKPDEERGGKK